MSGQDDILRARAAGFSDAEIQSGIQAENQKAIAAGFTPDEIDAHYGVVQPNNQKANASLARSVADALKPAAQTVHDMSTVYAPIETALNLATGLTFGFPAYLGAGVGTLIARGLGLSDEDPKEVAAKYAEAVTWQPISAAGKRLTDTTLLPLRALMEGSETAGKKVTDVTGSPVAGALTEATIQMLPAPLIGALGRRLAGKVPTAESIDSTARVMAPEDAPPGAVDRLSTELRKNYEQTGIDPQAVQEKAATDPTVVPELVADNPESGAHAGDEVKMPPARVLEAPGEAQPEAGAGGAGKPPEQPTVPAGTPAEPVDPQAAVLARITKETPTKGYSWNEFYTAMKDDLAPIKQIVDTLRAGGKLSTENDPYKLARLTRGANGRAEQFLEFSPFKFKTYENIGESLKAVLDPVKDDLDGLRAYAVSKRAAELAARGIETGVPAEEAAKVVAAGSKYAPIMDKLVVYQNHLVDYLKDAGVIGADAVKAMREANKDYVPFYRLMDDPEFGGPGAGLKTRDPLKRITGSERLIVDPLESIVKNTYLFTALADRNAVGTALVRLAEQTGRTDLVKKVVAPVRPITLDEKEIRKIFDEFLKVRKKTTTERKETSKTATGETTGDAMPKNTARVKDALTARGFSDNEADTMIRRLQMSKGGDSVEKIVNEITKTEYIPELDIRLPNDAATIFRRGALVPADNQIAVFTDGKKALYELPENVAAAFKATDRESVSMLVKILAAPAKLLRAGATLSPDFIARNPVRDQFSAYVLSKSGYVPILDMVRGAVEIGGKSADYQNWLKSGGANAAMVAMDRSYVDMEIARRAGALGFADKAWNIVKNPLEPLRIASELMENATRVGEFKKAEGEVPAGKLPTKDQILSAGFESREVTLDFARIGAKTRALNMITAFWNANLEGVDRVVRAMAERPLQTTAALATSITLPSVLLWFANHDDPRWKDIPNWERDLFWIVMTKDHIYRIPKPFELGVLFGSAPERLLDAFYDAKPDAFKAFASSVMSTIGVNMVPTAAAPIIGQITNYNFFTDRPLIPSATEKLLPEYQYSTYTTEATKALAHLVGAVPGLHSSSMASPPVIDNYIQSWSGGLGNYTWQIADAALRKTGVLPDPIKPAKTLADIPAIKGFVVRYPSSSAQSIQDFHDDYRDATKVLDTIHFLAQKGDAVAMQREMALDPAKLVKLDNVQQALSKSQQVIQLVDQNQQFTSDEKRQLIDTIYLQMIEMAHTGNAALRQIKDALGPDRRTVN